MKQLIRYYAVFIVLILLSACNNNKPAAGNFPGSTPGAVLLVEGFETGIKSSYKAGTVNLQSGTWYLDDALIAGSNKDAKSGGQSVRIKGKGVLRMDFDVDGVSKVAISYAAYQQNKTSGWKLMLSIDGGNTYSQVGAGMLATQHRLQTVTFIINYKGRARFQLCKTSGSNNRLNIDDLAIYSFNDKAPPITNASPVPSTTDTPVVGDNSNLLLGNPSNAITSTKTPDNYLIVHPYYTLSYNRSRGGPNWVSWYVGNEWLGDTRRVNDFRADHTLPPGWYHVQSTSYQGSGFERGHNCPSADRTSSLKANSATFLMTNMIPQAPANNQHTWGNLESYERYLVNQGNEVYIIMGNYGSGGYGTRGYHTTIDSGRVTVPAYIWKVIVVLPNGNNDLRRINTTTRVIAVITPNNNAVKPNWTNYLCTVRDIEKETGYNLLSKLPKSVQDAIETRKDEGINANDGYIPNI